MRRIENLLVAGLSLTVLLEMGNEANAGRPTGRRVAFMNSFAIENHFFNFSTAGQWLWDELQVSLPAGGDANRMAQQIRAELERETQADAAAAEKDWERVNRQYGVREFSAQPTVELRPSASSFDAIIRYITRAPQRHEVKVHLFAAIIDVFQKPV